MRTLSPSLALVRNSAVVVFPRRSLFQEYPRQRGIPFEDPNSLFSKTLKTPLRLVAWEVDEREAPLPPTFARIAG